MHRIAAAGALPPPPMPHGAFARSSPQDRSALLPSPLMVPRRPAMQCSISHAHNTNGCAMSAVDLSLGPGFPSRSSSPSRRGSPAPAPIPVVELEEVAAPRPRRRRASTTSSVFPSLPQNMSLRPCTIIGLGARCRILHLRLRLRRQSSVVRTCVIPTAVVMALYSHTHWDTMLTFTPTPIRPRSRLGQARSRQRSPVSR